MKQFSAAMAHEGEECALVLRGRVAITVGDVAPGRIASVAAAVAKLPERSVSVSE
mgnify:CR=1 FL=1